MNEKNVTGNFFRDNALILIGVVVTLVLAYFLVYKPFVQSKEATTQTSMILMDTVVDVRVDGRKSEKLVLEAFSVMEDLEATLSRFEKNSEVSKINQHAGEWVDVSDHTLELIQLGIKVGELSQGAFDITIGAVLDLWGFGSGSYYVPNEEELKRALATVDYTKVEIDLDQKQVRIPEGTILDLGGIAKGYVVDHGVKLLREANVSRAIINAGGDIAMIGSRPDGQPWRVGVQDPEEPTNIRWVLPLEETCVVTSGDYQRFFERNGKRWHHLIDPKTGYPATSLKSVTVVGNNVAYIDALATAVFVLGWDEGKKLVEELADVEAILVSESDYWISPGLAKIMMTE